MVLLVARCYLRWLGFVCFCLSHGLLDFLWFKPFCMVLLVDWFSCVSLGSARSLALLGFAWLCLALFDFACYFVWHGFGWFYLLLGFALFCLVLLVLSFSWFFVLLALALFSLVSLGFVWFCLF